ncbi:putative Laccase [Glarea lozoyensis 74030]|uniref:laccase n=1 Tax=Glarea lozoyensis (strain ATCC 74030 / MF5533) TaxID=1104152 RepID=H0EHI5_GLAL7|nr:putative Laccase [Glarea lozoyensis 74030]
MLGSNLLLASLALGLASAGLLQEVPAKASTGLLAKRAGEGPNCNGPNDRGCWRSPSPAEPTGFNIDTDSETVWPSNVAQGQTTTTYTLTVAEKTLAPDGDGKLMQVINGVYPGPVIEANWGDVLVIDVVNNLTNNGTSMHWHGVIQANSTTQDGVNGITECPIEPGATRRYTFIATQHGTSFKSEQGGPPRAKGALINGKMKSAPGPNGKGAYEDVKIEKGKTYRLRLINTSVDMMYKVSLDNHRYEKGMIPVTEKNVTNIFDFKGDATDKMNLVQGTRDKHGRRINSWTINDKEIDIQWENPTLEYLLNNDLPTIQNRPGSNIYTLKEANQGYLAIAIYTNNPGVWLMHCHIAWHVSQGLGVQFVERPDEILRDQHVGLEAMNSSCAAWDKWYAGTQFKQPDSGLRLF